MKLFNKTKTKSSILLKVYSPLINRFVDDTSQIDMLIFNEKNVEVFLISSEHITLDYDEPNYDEIETGKTVWTKLTDGSFVELCNPNLAYVDKTLYEQFDDVVVPTRSGSYYKLRKTSAIYN